MDMTINQLIVWLVGGGCVVAASWILERIAKYQALKAEVKKWIFFGVSAIIGISAYAVGAYVPVEILEAIAPYFSILAGVFAYIFLGTAFHKVNKTNTNTDTK